MKSLLYHRVHPRLVESVLDSQSIKCHDKIEGTQICVTRDVIYMSSSRPFVVIFDRDKLKKYFKVKPFCLLGLKYLNKTDDYDRWSKLYTFGFENEERIIAEEIPLELAEYVGFLNAGCFDYKKPTRIHSRRLFERNIDFNREKTNVKKRRDIRIAIKEGLKN